ncbi:MAG: ribose 5-phosphate isomerase B [Parcubacteria group bacterium Gr01-1014_3]|nr:MAG: ribose 5-phosphate isomerase B [Parcubacteria group bacterium Gr01-1014_3]
MKIYLAADHAGFELKEKVKKFLQEKGHEVQDFGASEYSELDDYPDFMIPAAKALSENPENRAIFIGGSGQGEAMVANRQKNVRAAVYYGGNTEIVRLSREHNNSNLLAIGARFVAEDEALKAIDLWLGTPFTGEERHVRRLAKF